MVVDDVDPADEQLGLQFELLPEIHVGLIREVTFEGELKDQRAWFDLADNPDGAFEILVMRRFEIAIDVVAVDPQDGKADHRDSDDRPQPGQKPVESGSDDGPGRLGAILRVRVYRVDHVDQSPSLGICSMRASCQTLVRKRSSLKSSGISSNG